MSNYSTHSTSFFSKNSNLIKSKLSYEWKNIFRQLSSIDLNQSGVVTKGEFIRTLHKNRVTLTREEVK